MFVGKAVIVTGAGRGIGKATAKSFAAQGAAVTVVALHEDTVKATVSEIKAAGGRAVACVADVSDWESVQRMIVQTNAEFGRIDVLVNNARVAEGIVKGKVKFWDYPIEQWDREIAVDLKGVMLCCKAVLPIMMQQRSGCIINIGSAGGILGAQHGRSGTCIYTAAKAGVIMFTRGLAQDAADYGIRVCCVSPGTIRTGGESRQSPEKEKEHIATVPLGRRGEPQEVANAILFLASEQASYITGVNLPVDGGRSSH